MRVTLYITEKATISIRIPGLPTHKQEFGRAAITTPDAAAKHMFFCLPWLHK